MKSDSSAKTMGAAPKKGSKFLKFISIVIFLGAIGVAGYSMMELQKLKKDPNANAKKEVQALAAKVGRLMVLPKEDPSVATVLKKEELKDQPFFKNAENEDKVLIYVNDKKAILYRPSTNKIIEVMPLSIDPSKGTSTTGDTSTPTATTPSTNTNTNTTTNTGTTTNTNTGF